MATTTVSSGGLPGSTLFSSWWSGVGASSSPIDGSALHVTTGNLATPDKGSDWKSAALAAGVIAAGTLALTAGLNWYDNARIRRRIRSMCTDDLSELAESMLLVADQSSSEAYLAPSTETGSGTPTAISDKSTSSSWTARLRLAVSAFDDARFKYNAAQGTCTALDTKRDVLEKAFVPSAMSKFDEGTVDRWYRLLSDTHGERLTAGEGRHRADRACRVAAESLRGILEDAPGPILGCVNGLSSRTSARSGRTRRWASQDR